MGIVGQARRRARRIGPGLAVVAALGLAASCVTNPGEFTATAGPGSFIELLDEAGQPNPESFLDIGSPACHDGADNDLDGRADTGADPQCDSASDANERLDGVQAYVPTTLPFQVESDGHFTVQPTDLEILPVEHCVPGTGGEVWCLAVTLRGAGGERQGSINGTHVELPIPITRSSTRWSASRGSIPPVRATTSMHRSPATTTTKPRARSRCGSRTSGYWR
jgi:hypothetical protein